MAGHLAIDEFANLVPLCQHHHHKIHDQDWTITIDPDRTVIIRLPDDTTLTAPPAQDPAAA